MGAAVGVLRQLVELRRLPLNRRREQEVQRHRRDKGLRRGILGVSVVFEVTGEVFRFSEAPPKLSVLVVNVGIPTFVLTLSYV